MMAPTGAAMLASRSMALQGSMAAHPFITMIGKHYYGYHVVTM